MKAEFKFRPIHFNWVAIHPQPIGVIHMIGGAFFGTFPTIFYRYLLRQLFEQGYTVIALPFRFTFRHWSTAISLVRDQSELRKEIAAEAKRLGYEYTLYLEPPTADQPNHFWLAHSLGCKYIALLELLSDLENQEMQEVLGDCVGPDQYQQIKKSLQGVPLEDISLKNQPSLLLAPVIAGIESAIPFRPLAEFIKKLGLDVQPDVKQTRCLINRSRLFRLTAAIAFDQDRIASNPEIDQEGEPKGTVEWLQKHVPAINFWRLPNRKHLEPLGIRHGDKALADKVIQLLQAQTQQLESNLTERANNNLLFTDVIGKEATNMSSLGLNPVYNTK